MPPEFSEEEVTAGARGLCDYDNAKERRLYPTEHPADLDFEDWRDEYTAEARAVLECSGAVPAAEHKKVLSLIKATAGGDAVLVNVADMNAVRIRAEKAEEALAGAVPRAEHERVKMRAAREDDRQPKPLGSAGCPACGLHPSDYTEAEFNRELDRVEKQRDDLRAELERVKAEGERLRETLEFYADPVTYEEGPPEEASFDGVVPIKVDRGRYAIGALRAVGEAGGHLAVDASEGSGVGGSR